MTMLPTPPPPRCARRRTAALAGALLLGSASAARAHVVSGTVLSPSGAPVANVDIDAFDAVTGNELALSGDFTDASGAFAVDLPTGLYDLVFHAPAPPTTTFLDAVRSNVLVTAPTAVGAVQLGAGVSLGGRVVDTLGVPQVGVDLDFLDGATGEALATTAGATDAFGRFLVAVPAGPVTLEVEPAIAAFPRLAPRRLELSPAANTSLGDIVLQPGFLVTATVRRTTGAAVANVDLDVRSAATGAALHTPGDNTNALGFVDIVLPAGTYTIQYCPPLAASLVSLLASNVAVAGDVALGNVVLQGGVRLGGRVTAAAGGAPLAGVDIDVRVPGTSTEVPLCDDDTGASGDYAVVVPPGTWDLVYTPRFSAPYASRLLASRAVPSATTVDATLAACGCLAAARPGRAGTGGVVPRLEVAGGCLRIPNPDLTLTVRDGRGGARAYLMTGLVQAGGLNLPAGSAPRPRLHAGQIRGLVLGGTPGGAGLGSATVAVPLSFHPAFAGMDFFAAAWVQDANAVGGWAWTEVQTGTLCN